MNHSPIMKSAAVVAAVFGLALLLAPNALLDMYKAPAMNAPGVYNSMLCGVYLLALAVMNQTASDGTATQAKHVILGTFVAMSLGLLVALFRQLTVAATPPMAWLNVAIFLVFAALYGRLQFAPGAGATAPPSAA